MYPFRPYVILNPSDPFKTGVMLGREGDRLELMRATEAAAVEDPVIPRGPHAQLGG